MFRRIVRVMLIPKPAKRAAVDEITLDAWLATLAPCQEDEERAASPEDTEVASNSGAVPDDVFEMKRTTSTAASEVDGRKQKGRVMQLFMGAGKRPDAGVPERQEDAVSPRSLRHKRAPKVGPGNDKALVAAGAQVVGQ